MTDHSSNRASAALVTDLYELTMAYGYWRHGMADREAAFSITFRENPFGGGFTVACGLKPAVEFVERLRFEEAALSYLATLRGNDDRPLFPEEFLVYLGGLKFECDVDAVPEGTLVFPYEPMLRVRGPILQAQIVESGLLNQLNFESLIATKAARLAMAAQGDPVVEFGLRRAQGFDGALSATRAAYIGGCASTSHVLGGQTFGIPVAGTLAHSWVMAFEDERDAFEAYAQAMPNNAILLVDTYDSLEGVRRAIEVGRRLREKGHRLAGVRLDSGDLAWLSIEARRMLDEAGFEDAAIAASNDLDEHVITSLKLQGARINLWGVGTRLVTGWDQPALGGIYKLNAIRDAEGVWRPRIKLSERAAKTSTPGLLAARRFTDEQGFVADMIYDELNPPSGTEVTMIDPLDATRRKILARSAPHEELLVPVLRRGERVCTFPSIQSSRERTRRQLDRVHPGIKRFVNPHVYPVGLEQHLHRQKKDLILELRGLRPRTDEENEI